MHSSSKMISHNNGKVLELFILNPIAIINIDENDLLNLTNLELITPIQTSVTLIKLVTNNNLFTLNANISSNANLALVTNAHGLIIGNQTKLEAEKLFITNYLLDEERFYETKELSITIVPEDHYIKNYGNISARNPKNSAIASDKLLNKGSISDSINYKTYVRQLVSAEFYPVDNHDDSDGLLGILFNFIWGIDYE
jgi:hypothetical protein